MACRPARGTYECKREAAHLPGLILQLPYARQERLRGGLIVQEQVERRIRRGHAEAAEETDERASERAERFPGLDDGSIVSKYKTYEPSSAFLLTLTVPAVGGTAGVVITGSARRSGDEEKPRRL